MRIININEFKLGVYGPEHDVIAESCMPWWFSDPIQTAFALEAWERMTFAGLGIEGDNPTPRLGREPKLRFLSNRHGLLAPFEYPQLYSYRRPYERVRPVVLELQW